MAQSVINTNHQLLYIKIKSLTRKLLLVSRALMFSFKLMKSTQEDSNHQVTCTSFLKAVEARQSVNACVRRPSSYNCIHRSRKDSTWDMCEAQPCLVQGE